jgi:hypothetical protein
MSDSSDENEGKPFQPLPIAATMLGVPAAWLQREAKAGRVPHLQAGRQILFNVDVVKQALVDRAKASQREAAAEAHAEVTSAAS